MEAGPTPALDAGGRAFRALGRGVVRRPWVPILAWILLLGLSLPLLSRLGGATQNSATNLPADSPSSQAAADLARLFPSATAPTASYVLLTGTGLGGPTGAEAVRGVARALSSDGRLTHVDGVTTLYSAYAGYLEGQARITLPFLDPPAPSPTGIVRSIAPALWGSAAAFYDNWSALVAAHPNASAAGWNFDAFQAAAGGNASNASPLLSAFYRGIGSSVGGFNASAPVGGTGGCAADLSSALACSDSTLRAVATVLAPALGLPGGSDPAFLLGTLQGLSISNFTQPGAIASASYLSVAAESGLPARWVTLVGSTFGELTPNSTALGTWADGLANGPVAGFPVPVPAAVSEPFLSADGQAALIIVSYNLDDSVTIGGRSPVFDDVAEIDRIAPIALAAAVPTGGIGLEQTGPAPLDLDESNVLAQNLAIVLPLTLVILVVITIAYFRAPLAPLVTFGGLGISIGLGIASLVGLSTLFGKVDPTALTLENTFVLGIGTDYSIFLVARYREELRKGAASPDAVVTAVTWAGQSVATSGGTAVLATLALAFSGVGLLSQWGEVLSAAVAITVLVSLTFVPALLTLLGPRVFWPEVGARGAQRREAEERDWREERGYFFRAGRRVQRRPWALIGLILLVSGPLVYVAVVSPLGYDFYDQLPKGDPATVGLAEYSQHFGGGAPFPFQVLVTFRAPLQNSSSVNVTELSELSDVTTRLSNTPGVARVDSPIGPQGASLAQWLAVPADPPGVRADLNLTLGAYLGVDGRSVLLTVVTQDSGLSGSAVHLLGTVSSDLKGYADGHPEIESIAFAGGAAVTSDLAAQTALATERMILAVSIGLLIVLFAVLRSVIIPPMAVATIGLSIGWAWGATQVLFTGLLGLSLFFFVPTVLFILILGLGIDYNIFLLTRVREERLRGRSSTEAVRQAVARTGGIITAAAVILAGAFAALAVGNFLLLRAIGFSVALAVILDAMVVRTYLVPSLLHICGDRVWRLRGPRPPAPAFPEDRASGSGGPV